MYMCRRRQDCEVGGVLHLATTRSLLPPFPTSLCSSSRTSPPLHYTFPIPSSPQFLYLMMKP
ncbi:hypothetical protein E2C01_007027 [Portunus trituberculatus]|uniref:Uncharacterized protein n=1 Tax=Portunus trituberculatus TaxID=210409 RepID=A0A5B7CZR5_PORTR|nr:hypothetical protein [Portunus trituberculatus]